MTCAAAARDEEAVVWAKRSLEIAENLDDTETSFYATAYLAHAAMEPMNTTVKNRARTAAPAAPRRSGGLSARWSGEPFGRAVMKWPLGT